MNSIHSLEIVFAQFAFEVREKKGGKTVFGKCGRDFFFYTFHYLLPSVFNKKSVNLPDALDLEEVERRETFGFKAPSWLAWTGAGICRVPKMLRCYNFGLTINGKEICSYPDLIAAFWRSLWGQGSIDFDTAMELVSIGIGSSMPVGMDISLGHRGLLDHLMFVCGVDEDNLYIIDTHQAPGVPYENILPSDKRFLMKLPKKVLRDSWTKFNRVWLVYRLPNTAH